MRSANNRLTTRSAPGSARQRRASLAARRQRLGTQLRVVLAALDRTAAMPRPAAHLAAEMVSAAAVARLDVGDADARLGALCAAYLVALDCGATREEFAASLRRAADNLTH